MRLINADALRSALEIEHYNDYDDLLRTERLIDNAPPIKTFTLADIDEQYRKGLEKGLEESRPHGEWIFDKDYPMIGSPYGSYKCSKCGMHTDDDVDNYCWFCGADMRKQKEGEADVEQ